MANMARHPEQENLVGQKVVRTCVFCGVTFLARNSNARCCSDRCRKRLSRWRLKLGDLDGRLLTLVDEVAAYLPYDVARSSACHILNKAVHRVETIYAENKIIRVR